MTLTEMHREDIKAELRKRFGTIRQFEISNELPAGSVHDVLRKRRWSKVEKAIEAAIIHPLNQSEKSDTKTKRKAHRLNAGGQ